MKATISYLFFPLIFITACMSSKTEFSNPEVDIIGHRGHVSAFPENTIESFLSAVKTGIEGIELDLVISADKQVVVSHEHYMRSDYMVTPDGKRIPRSKEKDLRLYEMTYDSIAQYDSGSLKNRKFRNQRNLPTYKPLLSQVFDTVEAYRKQHQLQPVTYFLEVKSAPQDYDISQPQPQEFVDLIMDVVAARSLQEKVIIMSFDAAILHFVKEFYPEMKVSYLWYKKGIEESLNELSFTPEYVSPYFKRLNKAETVASLQQQGIKVVPWTVNSRRNIRKMIHLGVDGIISDYPERVLKERNRLK